MMNEIEILNTEQRTACVLALDVSSSMAGDPIAALNAGLRLFQEELQSDPVARQRVEISIITFGMGVTVEQEFTTADQFRAPTLTALGYTPLGEAVNVALDKVAERKREYKQRGVDYTRPWVLLVTDGQPTDSWQSAASRIRREEADRQVAFFTIGVGNADMGVLAQLAPPNRPPIKLDGLKFRELFLWVSASQRRISTQQGGHQTALPPTTGWASAPL